MKRLSTLLLLALVIFSSFSYGQKKETEPSYNLDFLIAKFIEYQNSNEILLVFKYEPKKGKDFKPVISTKITYKIGESEKEKTEIIDNSNHAIVFYGNDINQKGPEIYSLIKNKVNLKQKQKFGIIVFHLRNLTNEYIDYMTFTYGLWEPIDEPLRIEKKYEIQIDI